MTKTILVTGGAGYIGSHTCVALLQAGYQVHIVDNFCNSKPAVLQRITQITGHTPVLYCVDIRDAHELQKVFVSTHFDAVIHFAGLKAVGESVAQPLKYYDTNVHGSCVLLGAMLEAGIKNIVFSSSATVYGDPKVVPIGEDAPLGSTNPYGRSKLMAEQILTDLHQSDNAWNIACLRYFNPVGAHESGLMGEDPQGIPNNLMPYISQVAVGKRDCLGVFGQDYSTPDGTGVRDYIHVLDLALGHVKALDAIFAGSGLLTVNLGTGIGYSVLDMLKAYEEASGRTIPYQVLPRRAGDVAACYADPSLAKTRLNWQAQRSLLQMCQDAWRWQSNNPNGYD